MFWNPPTANNNDIYPLYDAAKMDLNWPFLESFGINPANARDKVLPWLIAPLPEAQVPEYVLQVPNNSANSGLPQIPAEWDLFGDNACGTVDYNDIRSLVIGGELQANSYIEQDPIVGKGFQLLGNPSAATSPPRRASSTSAPGRTPSPRSTSTAWCWATPPAASRPSAPTACSTASSISTGGRAGPEHRHHHLADLLPRENLQWQLGDSAPAQGPAATDGGAERQGPDVPLHHLPDLLRPQRHLQRLPTGGDPHWRPGCDTCATDPQCADCQQCLKALAVQQQALQDMYQKGLDNVADIFFNPAYSRTSGAGPVVRG